MFEKKKILIVEDNTETQLIIKVSIRDLYEVVVVSSAEEALNSIKNNDFNLVLLDINLGGQMDGRIVLEKIRGELNLPNMPVIIITAYDLPETDKNFLMSLTCDYLEKPINKDVLVNTISKCLRRVNNP